MIVELVAVAAGSVVAITGFGCWFADRLLAREEAWLEGPPDLERLFAEKRRVLERDRAEWKRMLRRKLSAKERQDVTDELYAIDTRLLNLADEEAKTR